MTEKRKVPVETPLGAETVMPDCVEKILQRLNQHGFEAYVVGGSVRDLLMGKKPSDWDVCTSAEPDEIKRCFADCRTLDIGIKHGTVAVLTEEMTVEITTYRVDGLYTDGRRPDSVTFTKSLTEDLARRDFTVNAMAFHPGEGLIDPFGGRADLQYGQIRCVGEPDKRFSEDALRIMRGLRFSSVLGFEISAGTAAAMGRWVSLTEKVSRERISVELSKLILGFDVDRVTAEYGDILKAIVRGFRPVPVAAFPNRLSVRLAAVFPENTETCLRELKFSSRIVSEAACLNRLIAGTPPQTPVEIRKLLAKEGEEAVSLYFSVLGRERELREVQESGVCFSLPRLAVNGKDLMDAGVPQGKEVGKILSELLNLVIEEKLDNDRDVLIKYLQGRTEL